MMKLYIRNVWVIKFLSIWIDLILSLWSETHPSAVKNSNIFNFTPTKRRHCCVLLLLCVFSSAMSLRTVCVGSTMEHSAIDGSVFLAVQSYFLSQDRWASDHSRIWSQPGKLCLVVICQPGTLANSTGHSQKRQPGRCIQSFGPHHPLNTPMLYPNISFAVSPPPKKKFFSNKIRK